MMSPVRFFDITQPGIIWTSQAQADCASKKVGSEDAQKIKERLSQYKSENEQVPYDQFLFSRLYLCTGDKLCGTVRGQVTKDTRNESQYIYEICDMYMQVNPELDSASDPQDSDSAPLAQVYFQRNP